MRGCPFKYAGIDSEDFGLIMAFVGKSDESVPSGGEFEIISDFTPYSSEALLYGKKFETPLEFDVDIVSVDSEFDPQDITKIKGWLFGQDGWKVFKYFGEGYEDYHLKCLFIPEETYLGNDGFFGFKCKLSNISPYWYKNEITLSDDEQGIQWHTFEN